MLNIARIDDEQESLDIAKGAFSTFCESFHQEVHIKGFTRGDVFLDSLKDNLYDLVCSDIIRQPRDGIELAEKLRKIDKEVPLIFISSNETNVFSCFNYNPIGFIRKTNFFQDTKNIRKHFFEDVLPSRKEVRHLEVKSHGETILLPLDNIRYIESNHNYQCFHRTESKEIVEVRKLISELEEELSPYGFIRVHKGFLVNYRYIYKFSAKYLTLKDQTKIPLSRQNHEEVIGKYRDLTKNEMI